MECERPRGLTARLRRGARRVLDRARRRFAPTPRIRPEILEGARGAPREVGAAPRLASKLCTAADLESPAFRRWAERLGERWRLHRKLWEFCYVCQALDERGMLREGRRGLGFAVGREPLPAFFASLGCEIVATDLPPDDPRGRPWRETQQWAEGLAALNGRGLCPEDTFRRRVSFRAADMNDIPADLTGFDFTWSSCSFEHCGSIALGARFLAEQMRCLAPGGVAVHTTEFNLTSDETTLDGGGTVIFRRRDVEEMIRRLRDDGHHVEPLDLTLGDHPLDRTVDREPYSQDRHLRLAIGDWAATSIGLIVRRR